MSDSSNSSEITAIVALVVSVVALLTTVGQLLQQYFATADGYRRCQESVMGQWASRTRLRWRWRQFRFETLYTVPELYMTMTGAEPRQGEVLLLGDALSRQRSLATTTGRQGEREELVDWIPFLHQLHMAVRASMESERLPKKALQDLNIPTPREEWKRFPALVMREKSWDLQPPDAIRPLARTNLSAIAILARRMGMRWKVFRPEEGILRAEGHSHIITSTLIKSLGLVLQYSYTGRGERLTRASIWTSLGAGNLREEEEIYIPSPEADRLGSGVVRGCRRLSLPDFSLNTQHEIVEAFYLLEPTMMLGNYLSAELRERSDFTFPVADLVALTASVMTQDGSPLIQLPAPSQNVSGITIEPHARYEFLDGLQQYFLSHMRSHQANSDTDLLEPNDFLTETVIQWVLRELGTWSSRGLFEDRHLEADWHVRRPVELLAYLRSCFERTTRFFEQTYRDPRSHRLRYGDLLRLHLQHMEMDFMFGRVHDYDLDRSLTMVQFYFKRLPEFLLQLKAKSGIEDETLALEMWVVMMFRAFCWGASHHFVEGERVPTAYFGSQLPVFIG